MMNCSLTCMLVAIWTLVMIKEVSLGKVRKIELAEYDVKEFTFLHEINQRRVLQGQSQLKPSRLLTNYAQREATRLAKKGGLIYPQVDFLDNHFGYAMRIFGQDGRNLGIQIFITDLYYASRFMFFFCIYYSWSKDML